MTVTDCLSSITAFFIIKTILKSCRSALAFNVYRDVPINISEYTRIAVSRRVAKVANPAGDPLPLSGSKAPQG